MARDGGPPSNPGDYWVARTGTPLRTSATGTPPRWAMTTLQPPLRARLRFHHGDRGHIDHAARGHRGREDVRGARRAHENRPDRERIRQELDRLEGDIGGVEIRQDEHVGLAF